MAKAGVGRRRVNLFVVMGVAGCGKSTVAQELARVTHGVYLDADDYHSEANKRKMAAGTPLEDSDRWEWLDRLNQELRAYANGREPVFLACSALRRVYRDRLREGLPQLGFIYLRAPQEVVSQRASTRPGHFMPASLVESQYATLEEPREAIIVDATQPIQEVVRQALHQAGIASHL
jgi:gluconokinase